MGINGRNVDVIVLDEFFTDPATGVKVLRENTFTVWADANMSNTIISIEGITAVYHTLCDTEYQVYFDMRYDRNYIRGEIEEAIKCK